MRRDHREHDPRDHRDPDRGRDALTRLHDSAGGARVAQRHLRECERLVGADDERLSHSLERQRAQQPPLAAAHAVVEDDDEDREAESGHREREAPQHERPPDPGDVATGDRCEHRVRQCGRQPDEAGGQGRVPQTVLHPEGEDHPHARHAQEVDGDEQCPIRVRARAEQVEVDHGCPTGRLHAPLPPGPPGDECDPGRQACPDARTHGPLDEREHDEECACAQEDDAHRIQIDDAVQSGPQARLGSQARRTRVLRHGPGGRCGLRDRACGRLSDDCPPGGAGQPQERADDGEDDERDIHEERGPPAPFRPEHGDEDPAQDRSDRDGDADDPAEQAEGPAALRTREVLLDESGHLRIDEAGAQSHDDPGEVERECIAGESRHEGARSEEHEPGDEDPTASVDVTGPSRGDEHDTEGQSVAGQHPLEAGGPGFQRRLDRGEDDVDDGHAQQRQERDDQGDGQDAALLGREAVRIRC